MATSQKQSVAMHNVHPSQKDKILSCDWLCLIFKEPCIARGLVGAQIILNVIDAWKWSCNYTNRTILLNCNPNNPLEIFDSWWFWRTLCKTFTSTYVIGLMWILLNGSIRIGNIPRITLMPCWQTVALFFNSITQTVVIIRLAFAMTINKAQHAAIFLVESVCFHMAQLYVACCACWKYQWFINCSSKHGTTPRNFWQIFTNFHT